ncbi:hypothetical protein [Flavobacterium mesophilum]|uniref:hypothetical protein n=1 Tax=Flavobacterium mesophilum TaxID=3143495 RepID=UPI0031D5B3F1
MPLNSSGPISIGNICDQKGIPYSNASLTTLSTTNINSSSPAKPNGIAPHSLSEFYSYDHTFIAPSITINGYSAGYLYFTIAGTGYSPVTFTIKTSTVSPDGPWEYNTAGSTSPRIIGVPTATTWYQIFDQSTTSIVSNVYQYVVAADTVAPTVPASINCDYGSGSPQTSILIEWSASTDNFGVAGYHLQRKTGTTGTWTTKYTGPNRSYQDSGTQNTTYYYQIRAYDSAGNYSNFSSSTSWTTAAIICFVEGTLITLSDGTEKPIETLTINDLLLSSEIDTLNDTNDVNKLYEWSCNYLTENRVKSPIANIEPKIAYRTIIINNGLLEATPMHSQLICRNGIWKFIPIKDIKIGDHLYGIDKNIVLVTSVSINLEKKYVYPLSLSPSHTYFANGILTHNIKKED